MDSSQKLLVVIATDGEPTSRAGHVDVKAKEFEQALKNRQDGNRVFVTLLACTDDESCVGYFKRIDKVKGVDTNDDYYSERAEIIKHKGKTFKFTFGDYVVKCLLGPVDKDMDKMDKNECCIS
jgi:hypothetical protein